MASPPTESLYHVAMIKGSLHMSVEPTSKALAFFIRHGCQIQSSISHNTTLLYTLVNSQGFTLSKDDESILQQMKPSCDFCITIA
ncbi:unnamed protein product [Adineta steineri]|uniref:Uncharacterized protein n=1 Tax=Adineta steineri TaxID=433720 RepID=A0A813P4M2_9BILA|nr:unnamed protein product [Adineta steineri]CAF1373684.1 unnamed protein product [Adineta steineri]CAF4164912.1 unnamed protein product [Adineta steineri]CAF4266273.1 unnamed protein product [Adineta steineri]